jgi:hypothetical protein
MVRCFVGDMGRRTGGSRQGVPSITILDRSDLTLDTFGKGIIVVGDKGTVRDLWVRGSVVPTSNPYSRFLGRPGIEITSRGTVTGNVVERTTVGLRVRSDSDESVRGTVVGNYVFDGLMGVVAIPVGADDTYKSIHDHGKFPGESGCGCRLQRPTHRRRTVR